MADSAADFFVNTDKIGIKSILTTVLICAITFWIISKFRKTSINITDENGVKSQGVLSESYFVKNW